MSDIKFKNLGVGNTFIFTKKKLIVQRAETDFDCKACIFAEKDNECLFLQKMGVIPECDMVFREDNESVVFVEVGNEI